MKKLILVCLATFMASVYTWGAVYNWPGNDSETVTVSYDSDTKQLKVSGSGDMKDYASAFNDKWGLYKTGASGATSLVIEDGITHIGAYAFSGFSALTSVTIPTSVTSIGGLAFNGCSSMANIKFAGTPAEWASIDFQKGSDSNQRHSHPFGAHATGNYHYFFYGSNSETTTLVIEPTITAINHTAFFRGTFTAGVSIPGTVATIGNFAFYGCSFGGEFAVNRYPNAPSVSTNTFSSNAISGASKFYYPEGANGYKNTAPWNGVSQETEELSGNTIPTYGTNISWNLSQDGVLTLDASSPTASKTITCTAASHYPWRFFRRLVYKVTLRGDITALNNSFCYLYGISEIILDQATIPTCGLIATNNSTQYAYAFNPNINYILRVQPSLLFNATETAKFSSTAPWNDGHCQIGLSKEFSFNGTEAELDTLDAIQRHINLPFTMQLKRSMSKEYYNTFCSPIPMSAEEISTKFGADTDIRTLESAGLNPEDEDELLINFSESRLTEIEAGKPYIIKPVNIVSNPTFTNVAPSSIETEPKSIVTAEVTFFGTLAPKTFAEDEVANQNYVILTANTDENGQAFAYVKYNSEDASKNSLGGMRAYWYISDEGKAAAKRPVMKIGNETQGIDQVQRDEVTSTKVLKDGQLYLMYEGRMYDVRGMRVE